MKNLKCILTKFIVGISFFMSSNIYSYVNNLNVPVLSGDQNPVTAMNNAYAQTMRNRLLHQQLLQEEQQQTQGAQMQTQYMEEKMRNIELQNQMMEQRLAEKQQDQIDAHNKDTKQKSNKHMKTR